MGGGGGGGREGVLLSSGWVWGLGETNWGSGGGKGVCRVAKRVWVGRGGCVMGWEGGVG